METATAVGENKVRMRANGFFNNFTDPIMAIDVSGNTIPLSNRSLGVQVFGAEAEIRSSQALSRERAALRDSGGAHLAGQLP